MNAEKTAQKTRKPKKLMVNNSIALNKTGRFMAVNRQLRHLVCGFNERTLKIDSSTLDQRCLIRKWVSLSRKRPVFFRTSSYFSVEHVAKIDIFLSSSDENKITTSKKLILFVIKSRNKEKNHENSHFKLNKTLKLTTEYSFILCQVNGTNVPTGADNSIIAYFSHCLHFVHVTLHYALNL